MSNTEVGFWDSKNLEIANLTKSVEEKNVMLVAARHMEEMFTKKEAETAQEVEELRKQFNTRTEDGFNGRFCGR